MPTLPRILRFLAAALLSLAALVLVAWGLGRILTDRTSWSQYLFWIPSIIAIPAAGALFAAGFVLRSRVGKPAKVFGRVDARALAGAAWLAAALWVCAAEWRWFGSSEHSSAPPLRIIHWNASMNIPQGWERPLLALGPDVLLINPASYQPWNGIIEAFKEQGTVLFFFGFTVVSKYPVTRYAMTPLGVEAGLGIDPRAPGGIRPRADVGHAMFLEIDTTPVLGRPTKIVWLDLPSDLSLHRARVAAEVEQALTTFHGPIFVQAGPGAYEPVIPEVRGWPAPDIVIGDLNIPRGSASVDLLSRGLPSAYARAGRGPAATWPRRWPLWHLDQAFVSADFRVTGYRIFDPGCGTHRAQLLEIAAPNR